ncbi:MAG: hypothetical protein KF866_02170 [Phycisphaeraceae bacterium]|nr:hypothetical protein [Phycisphaeraceae bacterium]
MRPTLKRSIAAASLVAVLGIGAVLPAASAQPEQPRRPGDTPRQPVRPGDAPRQPVRPGDAPRQPGDRGEAMMSVQAAQRQLDRAVDMLGESLKDASRKDESLAAVAGVQRASAMARVAASRDIAPDKLDRFRREYIELSRHALDLELAMLDGKADQVKAGYDKVARLRDDLMERYGEGEPRPGRPGGR